MKTTLKKGTVVVAIILLVLCAFGAALRAQTDNQLTTDDPLQPVTAGDIPATATTFFLLSDYLDNGGTLGPPWPFLKDTNATSYSLNGNGMLFLVDDTAATMTNDEAVVNALTLLLQPQDQFSRNLMSANSMDPGDGSDTNSSGSWTNSAQWSPLVIDTNGLWFELPTNSLAVAGQYSLDLHNTTENEPYDILTSTNLSLPLAQWTVEQSLFGAPGDFTPLSLIVNGRPNLFATARFGGSSDGSGMTDWWERQYFGINGIDPYADPDGDGWNNLQEFLRGTNPTNWNTPPPPQNLGWHFDATGTNVVLTWQSGGGPVDHYEIERGYDGDYFTKIGDVDHNTLSFTTNADPITDYYFPVSERRVTAVFTNGDRSTSAYIAAGQLISLDRDCWILRGSNAMFYLALSSVPNNLSRVHVYWWDFLSETVSASVDFYPSNIVNGIIQFPQDTQQLIGTQFPYVQLIDAQGNYSEVMQPSSYGSTENDNSWDYQKTTTNFVNSAVHMKENLRFLLRACY